LEGPKGFELVVHVLSKWEVDSVSFCFHVLYSARAGQEGDDSLCWQPEKRRAFVVKTLYKVLPNVASPFPWKSSWRTKAPLRWAFFT